MVFPFRRDIGGEFNKSRAIERQSARSRGLGLSSMRAGDGSIDLIGEDGDLDTPVGVVGDLPDGTQGVGVTIDGEMVSVAAYSKVLKTEVATERSRNDSQDSTLASHNTRISTAQSTANGAVNVNTTQNLRLTSLEGQVNDAATKDQIQSLLSTINGLAQRIAELEWRADKGGLPVRGQA